MRLASYEALFRTNPVGHYASDEQFLIWCSSHEVCGMIVWGQPAAADLQRAVQVFDHAEGTGIAIPCDFVLDIRRLDRVDATLFTSLVREVGQRIIEVGRRVRRHAIVARPSELSSAVVSGFYALVGAELRWRITEDLAGALAWLEAPDGEATAAQLEQIVTERAAGSVELDRLRAWLREGGLRGTVDQAASFLGVSSRSLQRRLGEAGTAFRTELEQARLATAQRMLLDTDEKIAVIAAEIGSSSESNFIAFFRRLTGHTPAAWRAARRVARIEPM